jgi:hypothetical protein
MLQHRFSALFLVRKIRRNIMALLEKTVAFRMPPRLLKRLQALAEEREVRVSTLVRQLLHECLDRLEKEARQNAR